MFRKMRRIGQLMPMEEAEKVLAEAVSGVLAVCGDDGYPYAVPVNHVYREGKICFHCARVGHKLDAICNSDKVSFCVIAQDEVIPEERTTAFISVIAFGRAHLVEDEAGMRRICEWIGEKYCPDNREACRQETEETIAQGRLGCVEIEVEHLTGKWGREVMARRAQRHC